jgi:hypothetical protein
MQENPFFRNNATLSGLMMMQGVDPATAIINSEKAIRGQREGQRQAQAQQRMAGVEKALPEMLNSIDVSDPIASLGTLIAKGVPMEAAQQIIGIAQKQAQQQSLNRQRDMMHGMLEKLQGGGGTSSDSGALGYILANSDDPMQAGLGDMLVDQQKESRDIRKEERKAEQEIKKEKRAPNQTQSNSYSFGTRMANAERNLSGIDSILSSGAEAAMSTLPASNYMVSEEYQLAQQAAQDWVTANLRKESGAAIPPEEMAQEIKKYFPRAGDSEAVIEQKRKSRAMAYKGMKKAAGSLGEDLEDYNLGGDTPPSGIPPELWNAMTPEEKAAF